jgi:hypothetical protein
MQKKLALGFSSGNANPIASESLMPESKRSWNKDWHQSLAYT